MWLDLCFDFIFELTFGFPQNIQIYRSSRALESQDKPQQTEKLSQQSTLTKGSSAFMARVWLGKRMARELQKCKKLIITMLFAI